MDGVPMVGAMSPSRWEAATKLTTTLLLPTPESPMRRNLKEHSWPPLLPDEDGHRGEGEEETRERARDPF